MLIQNLLPGTCVIKLYNLNLGQRMAVPVSYERIAIELPIGVDVECMALNSKDDLLIVEDSHEKLWYLN